MVMAKDRKNVNLLQFYEHICVSIREVLDEFGLNSGVTISVYPSYYAINTPSYLPVKAISAIGKAIATHSILGSYTVVQPARKLFKKKQLIVSENQEDFESACSIINGFRKSQTDDSHSTI